LGKSEEFGMVYLRILVNRKGPITADGDKYGVVWWGVQSPED